MAKKSKKAAKTRAKAAAKATSDEDTTPPRALQPHEVVLAAANAVEDVLADFPSFATFARNGVHARVVCRHSAQLDAAMRDAIVALFEANMKQQYERSDWGYDAAAKMQELFEPDARYLLALDTGADATGCDGDDASALAGFVHFRFVDDDAVEVLYVYELQIAARMQRKGLGKFLMQTLLLVARKQRMQLVVLTVFKTNTAALAFYQRTLGFDIDETSPSACGDATQSYEILSKAVTPASR